MTTHGTAHWKGGLKDGKGHLWTHSGVLKETPYSFANRFEGAPGTTPEELIGAAHAGCFSMALSMILGMSNLKADSIETRADVTLDKVGDGFGITAIKLTLKAKVPGATHEKFLELAHMAKTGCPVSKALSSVPITLDAKLID
jgi:osmotically inducible protein OsmC